MKYYIKTKNGVLMYDDIQRKESYIKKNGFEVWGNTKNAFKLKDGTYRDEIIMGRSIL